MSVAEPRYAVVDAMLAGERKRSGEMTTDGRQIQTYAVTMCKRLDARGDRPVVVIVQTLTKLKAKSPRWSATSSDHYKRMVTRLRELEAEGKVDLTWHRLDDSLEVDELGREVPATAEEAEGEATQNV